MKDTLVLQSFGRESEYKRAILTILSYFAYSSVESNRCKALLFTDCPDYFAPYVSGLPVEYVLLTPEKIKILRGEIDFLHRMKIAVIGEAFQLTEGNLLYADSDTFFIADPTPLMAQVTEAKSFMHLWEYRFEEVRNWKLPAGETFHSFLQLIESKSFLLPNKREIKVKSQHVSWNAGVMMFHSSHERFIPDVYALTDQFYPSTKNHASEQYAFSIMLQENTQIQPCDQVIYHYWYRVKKQIIDQFLLKRLNQQWANKSCSNKLNDVRLWTQKLPLYFENHIWMQRDHAIQAFNDDKYYEGYKWAAKALLHQPLDGHFMKDVFYHLKRHLQK